MTPHDATEQAYKNGYEQGRKDALDNAVECLKAVEQYVNETGANVLVHYSEDGKKSFEFFGGGNR